jgi:hypothetical protein
MNQTVYIPRLTTPNTIAVALILAIVYYWFSNYLLGYYTEGDQVHYRAFYEALKGAEVRDIMFLAVSYVNSLEPVSAFILWAGSNLGIEKNIFISVLNSLLVACIFLFARQYRLKIFMIFLLLTNFYLVVLLTSAERLKISYIFLVLAAISAKKLRLFFLALTPLAHLQNIIFLTALALSRFASNFKVLKIKFFFRARNLLISCLFLVLIVFFIINTYKGINNKLNAYIDRDFSINDLVNLFILFVISTYVAKSRFLMAVGLIPIFVASILIGGSRTNMIAVTLVIFILARERRIDHPLIYLMMIYFSFKSIPFVKNILDFGNGFLNS